VALLTAAILSASGSAQGTGERNITLIERESEGSFHFVNNPPRGGRPPFQGGPLSAGDVLAFHQPLRNREGRRVGVLDAVCTAASGARNFERARFVCHGVYAFARGTIMAQAVIAANESIAVTGGTGVYEGATGSITSRERRGRTTDVIHLLG
jgi:hypothetical protein